ncbi:MAG: pyrrolysine--tRNA(Pyl) ligase large subunit [Methanomassiliicoccus sp.]|nr:pyrrolysine--tRNA(Pyl) ligase large subunit [Methanomassiliicoccus sp.]
MVDMMEYTASQFQRIREMGGEPDDLAHFVSAEERDHSFQDRVAALQSENRTAIRAIAETPARNPVASLEDELAKVLNQRGFVEVKTPMIISGVSLTKMGIADGHPLLDQVFWVGSKKCLRPMLAPNLYFLMRHLKRSIPLPMRLFEIGPCFRKESRGSNHLEEFTMLNLVELGPDGDAMDRLREHAEAVMGAVHLDYELVVTESEVYGKTLDVEVNGVELASGAVGPLPMDEAHGITDPWAGIGFGLERIAMLQRGERNIKKVGRSLIYLNGARIDV